ncbi:MAG: DUF4832 domain-containing protein [Ruminococcus sp.]|jgi:hypothetical protein|nr:DUF4832 domain-containing protein [Ruminococcus sp.]
MKTNKKPLALFIVIVLSVSLFGLCKAFGAAADYLPNENIKSIRFTEDTAVYTDPYRGFFRAYDFEDLNPDRLDRRRAENISLILLRMNLSAFKNGPIADKDLMDLQNSLDTLRQWGMTVIFRPVYDRVGADKPEPKDINIILGHITQMCEVLSENEDILFAVQPGLLGPYGEWHGSYYEDPKTGVISFEVQSKIVDSFYRQLPSSVPLQLRRPSFIRGLTGNAPVTASDAFGTSLASRLGYHNDALLSTYNDMGTYRDEAYPRGAEYNWTNAHMQYLPVVAEVCKLSEYCEPVSAARELDLLNVSSINSTHHPDVMNYWKEEKYRNEPAYTYIQKKLGYRFILNKAGFSTNTWQGNFLHLNLQLTNDGFGNLLRPVDFEIVMTGSDKTYTAYIDDDARFWDDDTGVLNKDFYFSLPSDMPEGSYTVSLRLSSTYDSLKNNPDYSVRFASGGVWDAKTGLNNIGSITIGKPKTPGIPVALFEEITRDEASRLNDSSKDYAGTASHDITYKPLQNTEAITQDTPPQSSELFAIYKDGENLKIALNGIDVEQRRHIFINTDQNSKNGYTLSDRYTGFDFMIEGNRLYNYTGEAGSDDWSWERNSSFDSETTGNSVLFTVKTSVLEVTSPIKITAIYRANSDNSIIYRIDYTD